MHYIKKIHYFMPDIFLIYNVPYPEDLLVRQRALHITGILFPKEGQNKRQL